MSIRREEGSTLGILNLDDLCNDMDSVFFGENLVQTVAKRKESFSQSLRLSYPSPPKINDLHGNDQAKKSEPDDSESSSRSTSSLSVSSVGGLNTTAFEQPMDSNYFLESSVFDPTSLRYSDSVISDTENDQSALPDSSGAPNNSALREGSVPVPSAIPDNLLSSRHGSYGVQQSKSERSLDEVLDMSLEISPDSGKTMTLPVRTLQLDQIRFLPQEIGARSTAVLENEQGKNLSKAQVSWNNSGFDVDFGKECAGSGFSLSAGREDFLQAGDAMFALNEDQRKFEDINALEISVDHDFGNSSGIFPDLEKSAAGLSLAASNIFDQQSWMAGPGKGRPSFGMLLQSPVRQLSSTMQSFSFSASLTEPSEPTSERYQTSYSVPKQKPERKGSGTRRMTLSELRKSISQHTTLQNLVVAKDNLSHSSKGHVTDNSVSNSVDSSIKCEQSEPAVSSSRSLQESPVPSDSSSLQVSQNSCQCPTTTSSALAITNYGMVLPARTHLVAPFNWNRVPLEVGLNSQQAAFHQAQSNFQCNQVSTSNICPLELPPHVVCLGERLDVSVPIENPFPQSLQCQMVIAGVFSNQRLFPQANAEQLVTLLHSGDILLPNQKKDVPITFLARVPGQLCTTVEVQWTTVGCPTIPSKMGKSTFLLNCEVVLPKVSIMSKSVTIKYHAFSDTAGTSSFALLNHTSAPVTVGVQVLLSGDEDHAWPDAEFFFVLDHICHLPGNSAHQWLNTTSPTILSLCLAAGSADLPTRANIPLSFKGGHLTHLPKERSVNGLGATVVVSTQNSQPARRLAAVRISVTPSQVPMLVSHQLHNSDQVADSVTSSSGKETPSLKIKKNLFFHPTNVNCTRKEELILRNSGANCSVSAYIEGECTAFQLCEDTCQKTGFNWTLNRKETLGLPVVFRPAEKICYQATLIVTATSADGATASNKVMLHGYGGCSKLSLHECSVSGEAFHRHLKTLRFSKGLGEEKQVVLLNRGVRHAFVFVAQLSADVSFSATKFVVAPFSQKMLTVKCHTRNLNQNLLIFHGEELFRQTISKKLPILKKPSLLHMFDATGPFEDQETVPSEAVYPIKEVAALGDLFYKHVLHFDIHLTCAATCPADYANSSLESTFSGE